MGKEKTHYFQRERRRRITSTDQREKWNRVNYSIDVYIYRASRHYTYVSDTIKDKISIVEKNFLLFYDDDSSYTLRFIYYFTERSIQLEQFDDK